MILRIQIIPTLCHGKPVFRGAPVLVSTVLGALCGGDSVATVLDDYPMITDEGIAGSPEFASGLSDCQIPVYETAA
jgi:uncharacterized protein (DUF433 family)